MSKESLTPYEAQIKRISFIEKAIGEGGLEKIPISERDQNLALVYNLNEELTAEKVGKIFLNSFSRHSFRERVNQINKRFLATMWNKASIQLQTEHPLSELFMKRPYALNPVNVRIRELILKGASPKDIERAEGKAALANARKTLDKRGIEIPLMPSSYTDFMAKAEKETDDAKLQELLEANNLPVIIKLQTRKKSKEVLISLSNVLREGEFHYHLKLRFFLGKIRAAGIPGIPVNTATDKSKYPQIYWIVYRKHKQRIINTLENDPDLQRFR
ncbi:MAG: hypothetical protein A3B47_03675 [Candidatus Levybacteria bacterium RIFCSPLOWO2_01_FULL_39_24]|nr:MAG: hypothetical protein A2800_03480 [Candidatus Levybacteria bacterium RIFCSPHIGHO2_01_FULL_40_16]OGH46339.1 MAG: hypothetical protein A3B47_03675 [Candidatus Levybacteria bacterium RIFCSPLOWO2_01_FULL_39_24]